MTGTRLFIVDDEHEITALLSDLVRMKGCHADSATDPRQALERVLAADYDVIIVDMMMPGLSGLSLVQKLRASERHARTPIVVLSSKLINERERKTMLESQVRFVSKPVTPARLFQVIRESLAPQP